MTTSQMGPGLQDQLKTWSGEPMKSGLQSVCRVDISLNGATAPVGGFSASTAFFLVQQRGCVI